MANILNWLWFKTENLTVFHKEQFAKKNTYWCIVVTVDTTFNTITLYLYYVCIYTVLLQKYNENTVVSGYT